MTEKFTIIQMQGELQQSQQTLSEFLQNVNDQMLYQRPSENEWTLAENLVHLAEARTFFANQVAQVLTTPGASIGRTLHNSERLQNVQNHALDTHEEIIQKIRASNERVMQILERMNDDDLQKTGNHVRLGPLTLAEFIRSSIVEHDQEHVEHAQKLVS